MSTKHSPYNSRAQIIEQGKNELVEIENMTQ